MRAVTIYTNLCDKVLLIDYSAQCSDFLIVMYWILDVPVFVGTRPVPSTQQDTMSSVIIRIYAVLQPSPCSESDVPVRNGESR